MTNFEMVKEFHEKFNVPIGDHPKQISRNRFKLRMRLIDEEFLEYMRAADAHDLVEVADSLADLLYVVYGTGIEYGINLDEIFAEVHRSNMSKLGSDGKPIYDESGKVLKGETFSPPSLREILKKQGIAFGDLP